MKTFLSYMMRTVLWLLMIGLGGIAAVAVMVGMIEWHMNISTWQELTLMVLNDVLVPAVIYSTAKWWHRRHGTKPSIFMRLVTHLLVLAIALPWFFLCTFDLIARPTTSEHVLWFLLEPLALLFLAFLAIGGILRAQGWDRHCIVRLLLGNQADADDAFQATFAGLLRRDGELETVRHPKAYLYRAARNAAISLMRKNRLAPMGGDALEGLATPAPAVPSDIADMLDQALARLPPIQREVIMLKVYDQMTEEDDWSQTYLTEAAGKSREEQLSLFRFMPSDAKPPDG